MDPYSPEGELINLHTAFHAGAFKQVLEFDTSSLSSSNALPARILKLRANIALGNAASVASELSGEKTPDLIAVRLLAESVQGKDVLSETRKLIEKHGKENLSVQLCGGIVLERAGETEEALAVLGLHQGSLDAVALIAQIHLHQHRTDLTMQTTTRARKYAQDSLLVNLAESWTHLRTGGADNYQSAFYVFEELAQSAQTQSPHSLVAQAVSEIHLGRLPEAEAALQQARELDGKNADTIANLMVLRGLEGKREEVAALRKELEGVDGRHKVLVGWGEKREEFEKARLKYTPKFEVAA